MGYQNYKWNISYDEGINVAYETIKDILKENNSIDFNNLIFLLNSRTKTMKIKKDNKTITISKFLKFCTKGVLQFIRNYDDFFVENNKGKIFIHLNNKEKLFNEFDDWIFINTESL
tara:strand:+ start:1393 stop:1740 length:348 start_codon:yes stop_codon:yes gene_type:complete